MRNELSCLLIGEVSKYRTNGLSDVNHFEKRRSRWNAALLIAFIAATWVTDLNWKQVSDLNQPSTPSSKVYESLV